VGFDGSACWARSGALGPRQSVLRAARAPPAASLLLALLQPLTDHLLGRAPLLASRQGPEIRTGMLEDGKPVQLTAGQVRRQRPRAARRGRGRRR
jgi:hypothetical protein